MADPLSILGAALGVISLGLQVRSEITSYCSAWRGAHDEIQEVANKAEALDAPLCALREIIPETELSDPDVAYDLQKKMEVLRGGVVKVKEAVDRWRPALCAETTQKAESGLSARLRSHRKRAAYPLRKEALRTLVGELDGLQIGLQTTLQIFTAKQVRLIPSLVQNQGKLLHELQSMHVQLQHLAYQKSSPPPPQLLQTWCDEQASLNPIYPRSARVRQYRFHSRLLNITIAASFALTRGAGGFSIAPSLSIRVPLSPNHPGFFSIYAHGLGAKSTRPVEFVASTIELLKYLFVTGLAGPLDTDSDGKSYLDASCFAFQCSSRWHPDAFVHFARLFAFLIDNGAPLSTSSLHGGTGLDHFVGATVLDEEKTRMLSRLAYRGGLLTIRGAFQSHTSKTNMRQVLNESEEVVDIPDVAKAIIQELEHDLLAELRSGRAKANDNLGGTTLLQLAVGWPRGLQILLGSGADIHYDCPMPPLRMAIREHHYKSVEILLSAGCALDTADIAFAESLHDNKMTSILISGLASRRKRLLKFAKASLSPAELSELGLSDSHLPDSEAWKITSKLTEKGTTIPVELKVNFRTSVYHCAFRKIETLDLLHNAGFKDTDSEDSYGLTPHMTMISSSGIFECAHKRRTWLISHGANPRRALHGGGGTVLHFLGTCFASMLVMEVTRASSSDLRQFQVPESGSGVDDPLFDLRYVLQDPDRDTCVCSCSVGGCTPLLAAVRHLLGYTPRFYMHNGENRFPRALEFLISRSDSSLQTQISILRLLTFDALDLGHTCCRKADYVHNIIEYIDGKEVEEIREEESLLLDDFESLLDWIIVQFMEMGVPLLEFLQGSWYKLVVAHISHLDHHDEEHAMGVQELGFKLRVVENVPERVSLMLGSRIEEIEHNT
ncbi:hypothetical protein N7532_006023 [Penicillium argentinense]|uniref:Fungal N-terminal domain-containing protein n=1 Tax=Penicillium argentinense TaxID=1131581 RepID=A0A9W9FFH1_9EURO|nr:uncharacterized protein N7532_006023 [Penicillium argentinense]KAJ5099022.1 hypothetical protein N7532_006023 [Penicillium argentinense]